MSKKQEIIDLLKEINSNLKKIVALNKHRVIKNVARKRGQ